MPEELATPALPLVTVVDDDESVRESLGGLLRRFGFGVRLFASGEEFLASDCVDTSRCLVLDVSMPGMSGSDVQSAMSRRRRIPIVFITGSVNEIKRAQLLAAGAVRCLYKPFSDEALLESLRSAFATG